jgi:hypothetical protein
MACAVADRGFKSVGDVGWAVSRSRGGSSANGCSRELGEQEGGWLLDVTGRYHGLAMDEPFLTSVKARQGKARKVGGKSSQVKSSRQVRSGQVKSQGKAEQHPASISQQQWKPLVPRWSGGEGLLVGQGEVVPCCCSVCVSLGQQQHSATSRRVWFGFCKGDEGRRESCRSYLILARRSCGGA